MNRTLRDLWQEEHEAVVERFVTGECTAAELVAAMMRIGMDKCAAQREADEAAAYEAERAHYGDKL